MPYAYIGVGANLGEAASTVRRAIDELHRIGLVTARSSLYRTAPWGVRDQPEFVNAVVRLETDASPRDLLAALKGLEADLGRTPGIRWGARKIDLDILVYDGTTVDEVGLTIPHPFLAKRAFVLVPLAEIDAAYVPFVAALPAGEVEGVTRLP